MALDFPSSPTDGQLYSGANGVVYQWSASRSLWLSTPQAIQDLGLGDFIAYGSGAQMAPPSAGAWWPIKPATILSGNSGSWYNSTTGRFTPPAGRYRLFGELTFNSSGQSIQGLLRWTKNGATILPSNSDSSQDTPAASKFGSVTSETIIDANGTDYFECHAQSWTVLFSVAYGYIGAMPLGVVVAMNNGFRLLSRQVLGASAADIRLANIPADINDIQFAGTIVPVTNAVDCLMQFMKTDGTVDGTGGNYANAQWFNSHVTTTGAAPSSAGSATTTYSNGYCINYPAATRRVGNFVGGGIRVKGRVHNIRSTAQPKSADYAMDYVTDDGTVLFFGTGGGYYSQTAQMVTGLRFVFSSGNVAAGSVLSVWGSP